MTPGIARGITCAFQVRQGFDFEFVFEVVPRVAADFAARAT